jgi:hypothetical protein
MKPKRDNWGAKQIILPTQGKKGCAWCPKRQKFYTSYQADGELQKIYNDCATREEAEIERDRLYTELLLTGKAKRKGEVVAVKREPKERVDLDMGICAVEFTVTRYRLTIKKQYHGTYDTKNEARAVRDRILAEQAWKPCKVCGGKPVPELQLGNHKWWVHKDCENAVTLKKLSEDRARRKWNEEYGVKE